MAKFNEQQKLRAVKHYLSGQAGYRTVACLHGVPESSLRKWIAAYQQHGRQGLAKKFQHYDAAFRLHVLQHMWKHDLSYAQTAAMFDIRNQGCLAGWERCYHSAGIEALQPRQRGRPKKMPDSPIPLSQVPAEDKNRTREELIAEINQLRMENAYLKKLDALIQSQQAQRSTTRKKRK